MTSRSEEIPDARARRGRDDLPPGQRRIAGFPRFGTHLHHPPPQIPADPTLTISGAIGAEYSIPLAELDQLPQVERTENFHCVAGWSATRLRWGGVTFAAFYRSVIEPRLTQRTAVTHLGFVGHDDYRAILRLDDALADDVLIATRLHGRPLTPAHGAPVRLVSPSQYGYVNTKHLRAIEVYTSRPRNDHPYSVLTREHPRARVWREERHPWFPGPVMRRLFRPLVPLVAWLSRRGQAQQDGSED
ncbi:molybdopterin-dependent oxidoreductase [Ruania halotolerans]|uniref:molybdopterin-dependent oxidoreductase n=1 Tax=Ruania halotolerans TaxID=2897773 RepID=UPI001E33AEE4|nr:molybdopterin-dependent oxidoreductase [Ruania halotolerans]UFU06167.1 molybdopterin-dependent oxidoreductase [Ruania halotolerans]